MGIFPNASKIHESCLYDQIPTQFKHISSRYQRRFWKGYVA